MRNSILLITLCLFLSCTIKGQNKSNKKSQYKITKTDAEWKKSLTKMQYYVLREAGTERAFSSSLDKNYTDELIIVRLVILLYIHLKTNLTLVLDGLLLIALLRETLH